MPITTPNYAKSREQIQTKNDIWVLNPKALPTFIEYEAVVFKEEDVALVSSRITLYMQNPEKTKA